MSSTLPKSGWLCASWTCFWSISFSWRMIGWLCWRCAFCSKDAKQPHSHLHPRCSQVLSKLYSRYVCVLLFKNDLTWTDKVQRSISIRHTDPPAVPCTSLQPAALLLQAAVLESLPHDLQPNLGIPEYAYSSDWPTDTWSSYVMKLWISCKKLKAASSSFSSFSAAVCCARACAFDSKDSLIRLSLNCVLRSIFSGNMRQLFKSMGPLRAGRAFELQIVWPVVEVWSVFNALLCLSLVFLWPPSGKTSYENKRK